MQYEQVGGSHSGVSQRSQTPCKVEKIEEEEKKVSPETP
jgi:hypothetical protein